MFQHLLPLGSEICALIAGFWPAPMPGGLMTLQSVIIGCCIVTIVTFLYFLNMHTPPVFCHLCLVSGNELTFLTFCFLIPMPFHYVRLQTVIFSSRVLTMIAFLNS